MTMASCEARTAASIRRLHCNFRIHVPGRTYYLEDASGDQAMAESWVQTICNVQALAQPPSARQAAAPTSPATLRIASLDSLDVE